MSKRVGKERSIESLHFPAFFPSFRQMSSLSAYCVACLRAAHASGRWLMLQYFLTL